MDVGYRFGRKIGYQTGGREKHVFVPGVIKKNGVSLRYYIHSCFIWHEIPGDEHTYFTCYPLPSNATYLLETYLMFLIQPDNPRYFNANGTRCCPLGGDYCEEFKSLARVRQHIMRRHFNQKFKCRRRGSHRGCPYIVDNLTDMKNHMTTVHGMRLSDFFKELEGVNDAFDLSVQQDF